MKTYTIVILIFLSLVSYNKLNAQSDISENHHSNTALLIIDIQYFYFPDGLLPLSEPEKAAENAQLMLNYFRENKMDVIHIKHVAQSGSEIHNLVKPLDDEKVITKTKANAFIGTDLHEYLQSKNIKNIVLCGMQTHMCLEAATRAASDYGYNCTVIEDACTTRDLTYGDITISAKDVHYSTLNTLNRTYATIITAKEFTKSYK